MANNPFHQLDVIRAASKKGKRITDCYRLMYKEELWIRAHEVLLRTQKGLCVTSVEIECLIVQLKAGTFRFGREKVENDMLVAEVIRMILENVYGQHTCYTSHGLIRRERPHDVLQYMKHTWRGLTWCIQGEIRTLDEQMYHPHFLQLLRMKINDHRFLLLIHNALICGIIKKWNAFHRITEDKVFGLLVRNVYFHAFDQWMKDTYSQRVNYVRYAGCFVIGVASTKQQALEIKSRIDYFLRNILRSQADDLFLTHLERPICFFGYRCRARKQTLQLEIPKAELDAYARRYQYGDIIRFMSTHRTKLINHSELEILHTYNTELRRIAHYYRLATNYHHLHRLFSLAESSFIKTIANKRKSTARKVALRMRSYHQGKLCLMGVDNTLYSFVRLQDIKKRWCKGE